MKPRDILLRNQTLIFILRGLTTNQRLEVPLFLIFLLVYIITIIGNILIIALIRISHRLHTPMYFLLSNLSFVDICYSSTITPNTLANFLSKTKTISFLGCATQFFFFAVLAQAEFLMLTVMAFDRYVAICNPLHYPNIMTKKVYVLLVTGVYIASILISFMYTGCIFRLSFCGSNEISNFYCDIPPLLKLSCSDTTLIEIVVFVNGGTIQGGSLIVIIISYSYIISTIMMMRSTKGRLPAFSTCTSHFICVIMFYTPVFFMYLRPRSSYSLDQDMVASVFYTVMIPMLNPLVYTIRNNEVKKTVKEVMGKALSKVRI